MLFSIVRQRYPPNGVPQCRCVHVQTHRSCLPRAHYVFVTESARGAFVANRTAKQLSCRVWLVLRHRATGPRTRGLHPLRPPTLSPWPTALDRTVLPSAEMVHSRLTVFRPESLVRRYDEDATRSVPGSGSSPRHARSTQGPRRALPSPQCFRACLKTDHRARAARDPQAEVASRMSRFGLHTSYLIRLIAPQAIGNVTRAGIVPSEATVAGNAIDSGTPCTMATRWSRSMTWPAYFPPNAF